MSDAIKSRLPIRATLCVIAACASQCGCKSARDWRENADARAEHHIGWAQQAAGAKAEQVDIETPADTLRRRLMLSQNVPMADDASLGIRDLPSTKIWRGDDVLGEPSTNDATASIAQAAGAADAITLSLADAVQIAAANSDEYKSWKEGLFTSALDLDLEARSFRTTFTGLMSSRVDSSYSGGAAIDADGNAADSGSRETSMDNSAKIGASRKFANGAELSGAIAFNLAQMLSGDSGSVYGLIADASISIPLLRGSGKLVVMEPLTQTQRNLVYAVRDFEQNRRGFVVKIAQSYLGVLLSRRVLFNAGENYKRAVAACQRSRRMADAGRIQEYEFDQSYQNELSAKNSFVSSQMDYEASLDSFKMMLGLPPDCRIDVAEAELLRLREYVEKFAKDDEPGYGAAVQGGASATKAADAADGASAASGADEVCGPMEIDEDEALRLAFENRADLRTARDRVEDAQRHLRVAEDGLRAEVTLGGAASVGERKGAGASEDAKFDPGKGLYSGFLSIDLPLERTSERNAYRKALISVERSVRDYQAAEDSLKKSVRDSLRSLKENRESLRIQFMAVDLAEKRVSSTDLMMQAGRVEMRDVLDAQNSLLAAQNSLYSAIVGYRTSELDFLRVLGLIDVDMSGVWSEPSSLR